jgi:hypothetical protein
MAPVNVRVANRIFQGKYLYILPVKNPHEFYGTIFKIKAYPVIS